jgi:hypothetical protein
MQTNVLDQTKFNRGSWKKCATSFSHSLCQIFNRSSKMGRETMLPIVVTSLTSPAVAKLFELLVCRTCYEDLRGPIYEGKLGRSTVTNLINSLSYLILSWLAWDPLNQDFLGSNSTTETNRPSGQLTERKNTEFRWCDTHWPIPEIFRWKSRSFV